MFNVLNSLVSLARKKSDRLEPVIIQLSHLMRYMLYDSGVKKVTIEKEIQYLRSYIDLQKLRFGEEVTIRFDAEVTDGDLPVEPMLLIPFVENAFKHGVGMIDNPSIEITLSIREHALDFRVKNKFNQGLADAKDPGSGIGIQNVQRRLELLYRDLHQLSITTEESWFIVQLNMILR
jgi:LytS/YehU family sensor histidine kinase